MQKEEHYMESILYVGMDVHTSNYRELCVCYKENPSNNADRGADSPVCSMRYKLGLLSYLPDARSLSCKKRAWRHLQNGICLISSWLAGTNLCSCWTASTLLLLPQTSHVSYEESESGNTFLCGSLLFICEKKLLHHSGRCPETEKKLCGIHTKGQNKKGSLHSTSSPLS